MWCLFIVGGCEQGWFVVSNNMTAGRLSVALIVSVSVFVCHQIVNTKEYDCVPLFL